MINPDYAGAKKYVLERLERELSPMLFYHSVQHTRDDVLPAAKRLAKIAGIGGEDLLLLKTAALYHDAGYLQRYEQNEEIAVQIVEETLPSFGFAPAQIKIISQMIMATKMPQSPQTFLEQILCDADMDTLGRDDFFVTSQLLRLELMVYNAPIGLRDWYEFQLYFLDNHTYFTDEARSLRDKGRLKNLAEVRTLLYGPNAGREITPAAAATNRAARA